LVCKGKGTELICTPNNIKEKLLYSANYQMSIIKYQLSNVPIRGGKYIKIYKYNI